MCKGTVWLGWIDRALKYFRRFRLIRTLFLVISYIVTFLGTGVALIVVTAFFLVIIPAFALLAFSVVFISLFQRKKICRIMAEKLDGKKVCVFFPSRETEQFGSAFLRGQCLEAANRENGAALVVSPFFLSSRGMGGKGLFLTAREESVNVYLVRRYSFFALRRRVLKKVTKETVCFF